MILNLQARIQPNPARSQNKLAQEMKVSRRTVQRALRVELGVKPYKKIRSQHAANMEKRLERLKHFWVFSLPPDQEKYFFQMSNFLL